MSTSTICSKIIIHLWLLLLRCYVSIASQQQRMKYLVKITIEEMMEERWNSFAGCHFCSRLIISYYGTSSKVCILAFMRKSKIPLSKLTHIAQRKYVEVDLDGAKTHFTLFRYLLKTWFISVALTKCFNVIQNYCAICSTSSFGLVVG